MNAPLRYSFPAPEVLAAGQHQLLGLLQLIRPWTMRRNSKVRLGSDRDGGYVLPSCISLCDAVLSIGVGHDVSFDHAMAERGALILQYDHTVEGPPTPHPNFRFQRKGWGPVSDGDLLSFDEMHQAMLGLGRRHLMLKFDVEGAEYPGLDSVTEEQLSAYEIVACELHHLDRLGDPAFFSRVQRVLRLLSRRHKPVHLHANNSAPQVLLENVAIPTVVELTYLRDDLDVFAGLSHDPIPGPLDRPNHPGRPDICLNPF
jgi:hypothetical protein